MKPFIFKQFTVHQDQTAMKVGTDAVLLGAWAEVKKASTILDVGTGTGILSLMAAQRNPNASITAIEIEKNAFKQASYNFQNATWASRLNLHHISFQNFTSHELFDCIISNPPFFDNQHFSIDETRTLARHTTHLSYETLIQKTASLLKPSGQFHVILPFQSENHLIDLAQKVNLFPTQILRVRGNVKSPLKRSLLTFCFSKKTIQEDELTIELSRHHYTEEYIRLTKDFYLKM